MARNREGNRREGTGVPIQEKCPKIPPWKGQMSEIEPLLTGNRCQCSACNKIFRSEAGFNKHRKNSRCLTTREMENKGMVLSNEIWITAKNTRYGIGDSDER